MNKSTQGKGDTNRTTNWEAYRTNYDRVFGTNKKKKLKLTGVKDSLNITKATGE
jgi:hypothetical protein